MNQPQTQVLPLASPAGHDQHRRDRHRRAGAPLVERIAGWRARYRKTAVFGWLALVWWIPMFMFVLLFGLSMDYHVFILSRIRELCTRGASTRGRGVGLAAAVLIDATVVRGILLPAAMSLLGERCWYLPRWLSWLPARR